MSGAHAGRPGEGGAPALQLATRRLRLRPPRPEDAQWVHRLVNDWGIVRMLTHLPFPYPRELAGDWIASVAAQAAAGDAFHFIVEEREGETPALLGCVGVRVERASGSGELGYWIGRPHWNQGFASEAASCMARWALDTLGLARLTARVATDNAASAAVLRRIGFRDCGEARQQFMARGGSHPVFLFEATAEDLDRGRRDLPLVLVAAAALLDGEDRILLARRPPGRSMAGLWEFPGGKLEPAESPEQALVRELREELGISVRAADLRPCGFASHRYERFHLLMPLFLCRRWQGTPEPREGQALLWVPPADLPLVEALQASLARPG